MTGCPSCFRARATFTPLPPGSRSEALARWFAPSWKLGTRTVRSRAALRVIVTIMGRATPRPARTRSQMLGDPAPSAATSGLRADEVPVLSTLTVPSGWPAVTGPRTCAGTTTRWRTGAVSSSGAVTADAAR